MRNTLSRFAGLMVALAPALGACETTSSATSEVSAENAIAVTETVKTAEPKPSPPAGPVPIPYPNVAAAQKPAQKSGIASKEVMLKDSSQLKKSSGD